MFDEKYNLKLNAYGNVEGMPEGWIKMPTDDTERYEDQGIPVYTARLKYKKTKWGNHKPITAKITHKDYEKEVRKLFDDLRIEDVEYISRASTDRRLVVKALYSICMEATRQRDLQEQAQYKIDRYQSNNGVCDSPDRMTYKRRNDAERMKRRLYKLKDKALRKIIANWGVKPLGYHVMPDGKEMDVVETVYAAPRRQREDREKDRHPQAIS